MKPNMNKNFVKSMQNTIKKAREEGMRFRTFHLLDLTGFEIGRVTAAIGLKKVDNDLIITVGLSFCGPRDLDNYNKQEGQTRALLRYRGLPQTRTVSKEKSVIEEVKSMILYHADLVNWLKEAFAIL